MEDIVAVEVELDNGQRRYFLTWGRIQDKIESEPLERLILEQCKGFGLGGKPVRARLCLSLQEASREPYFYECFFMICQQKIPFGDGYDKWKKEMDKKMNNGKELYLLGSYT